MSDKTYSAATAADQFALCALMPTDTPEYMTEAWLGALHYAIGEPSIVARYRADTDDKWMPASTAIDKMIDEASGRKQKFLVAFVGWFNEHVWGPINAPDDEDHADSGVIGVGS